MVDAQPPPARRPKLGDLITRTGLIAWSIVGILLLLWVLMWVVGRTQVLLAPVVVSVAIIYLLNPLVTRLAARRVPRLLGTGLAYVIMVGAIVALGFLVVPSISSQAAELTEDFPNIYADSTRQIEDLIERAGFNAELWSYEELTEFVNDPGNQDQFFNVAYDRLGAVTSGVFEAVLVFFIAPAIAFYVLIDLPRVRRETMELIPESNREEVAHVSRQLGTAVGGFMRGQLFVALVVGVMMSFGFWLIGLDFWLIVGMIGGFLNIIPFIGPWVGGALGVLVGLVTGDVSTAMWAGIVALVVQQIDNNFVSPTVLRATVRLHPAVVILVLVLGGAIGGLWGVLLAVPVTASIKIIVGHLWRTRALGQSWHEASEALIDDRPPESLRTRRRSAAEAARARAEGLGATIPAGEETMTGEDDPTVEGPFPPDADADADVRAGDEAPESTV
jgi:predicted PurR-regulated permease PerM